MSMKLNIKKAVHELKAIYGSQEIDVSMKEPTMKMEFYRYNLSLSITAALILCVVSVIGLIGTFSPFVTGIVLQTINATFVYLLAFSINLFFLLLLVYELNVYDSTRVHKAGQVMKWFLAINMIIASLTFYTTQKNSSFFFEYILVTLIINLIPVASVPVFVRNNFINLMAMICVLGVAKHPIAWQDIVDIIAMYGICLFVNYARLVSLVKVESNRQAMVKEKDQFYQDSRHDELTQLLNRFALKEDFPTFLHKDLCVALIDIDFFKNYNDHYGHSKGDEILTVFSKTLQDVFDKDYEISYRYGGDEFLLIAYNEDPNLFHSKLIQLSDTLMQHEEYQISCSIGYYGGFIQQLDHITLLINKADRYLYEAKHKGTGQIVGYIPQKENILQDTTHNEEKVLDALTALPTMHTFFKLISEKRKEERDLEKEGELAVLYFDLMNFKLLNLRYGITEADQYLKNMATCLMKCFPNDIIAHLESDRFAILTHTIHLDERVHKAHDIIKKLFPENIDCSIGICVWNDHSYSAEKVYNCARIANDESRKDVGTFYAYYSKETGEKMEMSAYVVSHLEDAIKNDWIVVYYQPIVRTLSNKICGMEALARWQDPEHGLLQPISFIPALEEARMIWRLDLYVIKKVIMQIAQRYRFGIAEIPVSINLSRLDFMYCDIFREIEALVMEYDVPRRMLHIEITESIMTSKESHILQTLQSFQEAGYEIWMDDFGSGYSTLNLLKDYTFDVLKLDMVFLRQDSSRSRDIIASVINMDKSIGIRSLAEGVETAEQVEFLKKCGCEKIQGYYFGKPMPFDDLMKACNEKGLSVEGAKQKVCYDKLSQVNFMSDIPLVVAEYQEGKVHILFVNEQLKVIMKRDGFVDVGEIENNINNQNNVVGRELVKAARMTDMSRNTGEIIVPFNNKERLMRYHLLGQYDGISLIVAHIYEHGDLNDEMMPKIDMLLNLSYFYHYIYSIDPQTMRMTSVLFSNSSITQSDAAPLLNNQGQYAHTLPQIFVEDEIRYQAFINPTNLIERLKNSKNGEIIEAFRTQDYLGRFVWMTHLILLVPNSHEIKILYVIRAMDDAKMMGRQELLDKDKMTDALQSLMVDANYFKDIIHHCPIPFFWKDQQRRFIGVSKAFLDFYGFKSEEELIGKTDEEMKWHPNNENYKVIEENVLKTGKIYKNMPGHCIVHGVSHEIYASKWPTYQNGQISGLMGYFLDQDLLEGERQKDRDDPDKVLATMGASHFIDDLIAFKNDYELNRKNFGVIFVRIPELLRIGKNFDRETMREVTRECYEVIAHVVGVQASIAYLDIGRFAITASYLSPQELVTMADGIREGINNIRSVNGVPCSLYAKVKVFYTTEVIKSFKKITQQVLGEEMMAENDNDLMTNYQVMLESLCNEIPIGCYMIKPDHRVVFWNHEAEKLLGFKANEMQGKKCVDMPLGCSFTSGNKISGANCPAMIAYSTQRAHTIKMFMKNKEGNDVLMQNTIVPIKNPDGVITELVSFFVPLTHEDYDQDLINKIYEVATRDPLTCLPGRKYMEACLEEAMEIYHRTDRPFAVLFADANNFHDINNAYGHNAGDAILRNLGLALRQYGRKVDRFCRWGGDEFVGLLQIKSPEDIKLASKRFMKIADNCYEIVDGKKISCQAAIGITVVREDDTIESVIARADHYMYQAKKSPDEKIVTDYTAIH